jgi:hypothetical protein
MGKGTADNATNIAPQMLATAAAILANRLCWTVGHRTAKRIKAAPEKNALPLAK